MRGKIICKLFSLVTKAFIALCLMAFIYSLPTRAEIKPTSIVTRPEMTQLRREALAQKLRAITGWTSLKFDQEGFLRLGENTVASNGSQTARDFLKAANSDKHLMVLEDASNRADIVFCDVVEGRWVNPSEGKPPVYVIRIDFADFEKVIGHKRVLESFNEGWGVLHEISHVVHDSIDAHRLGEVGECEELMNQMRRDCDLAERAEYFHTYCPTSVGSAQMTSLVRLAFDWQQPETGKKKRYWLIWDARLVGGADVSQSLAAK